MEKAITTPVHQLKIQRYRRELDWENTEDLLVTEEPLEIRVAHGEGRRRKTESISVTMRTPGYDSELVAGFLFTEGLLQNSADILRIRPCTDESTNEISPNIVRVELREEASFQMPQRNTFMSSSCGICGKSSIDQVATVCPYPMAQKPMELEEEIVLQLPETLRKTQTVFTHTGGIHAAALFDKQGQLISLREDVGRHNAVDKVIGEQWLKDCTPLADYVLLVSGRVGFEIAQKAAMAGIGAMASIGAPSGNAVELLRSRSIPLYGFIREGKFNRY